MKWGGEVGEKKSMINISCAHSTIVIEMVTIMMRRRRKTKSTMMANIMMTMERRITTLRRRMTAMLDITVAATIVRGGTAHATVAEEVTGELVAGEPLDGTMRIFAQTVVAT